MELVKLLCDMQATGDQTLRSRLSDRVCDILSCISAHNFCVQLLSLPSIQSSISEGEWQRLEVLAGQAIDSKVG